VLMVTSSSCAAWGKDRATSARHVAAAGGGRQEVNIGCWVLPCLCRCSSLNIRLTSVVAAAASALVPILLIKNYICLCGYRPSFGTSCCIVIRFT
jgi:hypothetical protein